MKKSMILTVFALLLISSISAEIVIVQQPNSLYNLGDIINIPVKVKSLTDTNGLFGIYLICNGIETEVYKEYIFLIPGEEKERNPSIPLIKDFIGRSTGKCRIKSSFKGEAELTNEFKISDLIKVDAVSKKQEFAPEEEIAIDISAVKENGKAVEGFVDVSIGNANNSENIEVSNTVTKGYSHIIFTMSKETKAGEYFVRINVSEKDSEDAITNVGYTNYKFTILQVPTNLELTLSNSLIEPGTSLISGTVLHDQTGEPIDSNVTLTVRNSEGLVMEKIVKLTTEPFEFPISSNEPPKEWKITAESNGITTESQFEISEKKLLDTVITNETLTITNIGNVLYNDTLLVKIGNSSVSIDINLNVGETKEYSITAPDGNYKIEIINHEGESKLIENIPLTGKTISIKESSQGIITIINHPFVWVFIIGIMGLAGFMLIRKGYKKGFIGTSKIFTKEKVFLDKSSLLKTKNKAELSLSIKGNKQNINLMCLKIKNLREIKSAKGGIEETLQKITGIAEENKAEIYENQESIFFIFAPSKTKSFDNEKKAINTAMRIKNVLDNHNKLFRQVIDFGISISYGVIIANQDGGQFKFMSMGTLVTTAKKLAMISNGEVLLDEKTRERIGSNIKTQKQTEGSTTFHIIKEVKDTEQHKKFLASFMKRMEGKD